MMKLKNIILTTRTLLLLAIIMALSSSSTAYADAELFNSEDDFQIEMIDGGKSVRIEKYFGKNNVVNIPPQIKGKPVTEIGEEAFRWMGLTSVIIPNGVTIIGDWAFFNNQLENITIPNSVIQIRRSALSRNKFKTIIIPNSVTNIGANAFDGNELEVVTIQEGVIDIGEAAFWGNKLTFIAIPNSVTRIREEAFVRNYQLKNITIGANVELGGTIGGPPPVFGFGSGNRKVTSFDHDFDKAYKKNKRRAGTYILNDKGKWVWQKENSK